MAMVLWAGTAGLASAQEKTEAATRQYNAAVGLHNAEAYDLAAREWAKFLQDYPKDPRIDRAQHYLGICYSKQNDWQKAAETFEAVVKNFPSFSLMADTLLNLGLTQYNIAHGGKPEMYDQAAATFRALATKFPNDKNIPEATFFEGECLYNRGKREEAATRYGEVVKKYPAHAVAPRAMFAMAVAQTDLGQHEQALANYDQFLAKYPQDALTPEASMWRGESLYALKRFDDAVAAYAAAAAKGFAMADYATVRQADALSALKRFGDAAAVYASVPAKFAGSKYVPLCGLEAGKKYYAAGDYAKSQEQLGKVIAAGGAAAPEAAHWTAQCLLKQHKAAEALAAVEKALPGAAGSDFAAALLMDQADAAYEIPDRRGQAVALYAGVASKHPQSPEAPQALYMAAFASMNAADYAAAVQHAKAFLAAHPDHHLAVGAKHVLAESCLLLNNYPEAEALYVELLQKAPGDQDAEIWKVHRGTAMYLQKKYAETVETLKPAIPEIKTPELVAEAWYRIGRSQAELGRFDEAIQSLSAALAAAPKWKLADDTHLVLGYAYQQTGALDKAKEQALAVIGQFPETKLLDMAHYRVAECCRLQGDLKTALEEYQLLLKQWPDSSLKSQALYGLGWTEIGLEDYAGAEKHLTELVDNYPNDKLIPRARYGRGMARRQLKQFGPAAEDIEAMLPNAASPDEKVRAMHILGLSQKGLQQYDKAVATFLALLAEQPAYEDADNVYFEMGWSFKSLKKEDEAAKAFSDLLEKFPDSELAADAQYLLGDHAYDRKDYKSAAKQYYAAMTKAGKSDLGEEAAYKLGLSYYLLDDVKNAQQTFHYQRVTWPKGPLFSDGLFMEAECLFKQDQFKESLAAYEQVVNPSNKDINILTLLHASQAAAQLGEWEKSLKLAEKLTTAFPDAPQVPQALYEQGWAQQNLGKPDEAMKLYAEVVAKTNLEPAARAQFMIGEIQFERKQYDEAVTSFFKVSFGYGYPKWQANATYEAARCFEMLKKTQQAVKQYEKLIEKFPGSDKAPLAKERLQALR
jgi:TolA-binding protein